MLLCQRAKKKKSVLDRGQKTEPKTVKCLKLKKEEEKSSNLRPNASKRARVSLNLRGEVARLEPAARRLMTVLQSEAAQTGAQTRTARRQRAAGRSC